MIRVARALQGTIGEFMILRLLVGWGCVATDLTAIMQSFFHKWTAMANL
jgi:hypothetical protein